jgi:hypothetical protein
VSLVLFSLGRFQTGASTAGGATPGLVLKSIVASALICGPYGLLPSPGLTFKALGLDSTNYIHGS